MKKGIENLERLRAELELLQTELEPISFTDPNYDDLVAKIASIQKVLNADTELKEQKRDRITRIVGGVAKTFAMGTLYLIGMSVVTKTEEERPIISKALNVPQNILKL